jgi:CBS-domain-containing membrane protein
VTTAGREEEPRLAARPLRAIVRRVEPLRPDDLVADAASRVAAADGGLPVADEAGRLIGFVSERDLLTALVPSYLADLPSARFITRDFPAWLRRARTAARMPVAEVMTAKPKHLTPDDSEAHAAELFMHTGEYVLPVAAGGRVVGIVRMADVVDSILAACAGSQGRAAASWGGQRIEDREARARPSQ